VRLQGMDATPLCEKECCDASVDFEVDGSGVLGVCRKWS
jgi:hypothetical protein